MTHARDQRGTCTAEYAVGTVAATSFACMLLLAWPWIDDLIRYCLFWMATFVDRSQVPVIPL